MLDTVLITYCFVSEDYRHHIVIVRRMNVDHREQMLIDAILVLMIKVVCYSIVLQLQLIVDRLQFVVEIFDSPIRSQFCYFILKRNYFWQLYNLVLYQ